MNFLPQDKSFSLSDSKDSWLGSVETRDDVLKDLGEDFAKSLFGTKDRFTANAPTNKLVLKQGTGKGYIVELSMVQAGEADQRRWRSPCLARGIRDPR